MLCCRRRRCRRACRSIRRHAKPQARRHGGTSRRQLDLARANVEGYSRGDAPAVLMEADPAHKATRAVFNSWRTEIAARQGTSVSGIDWSAVSPGEIWRVAEEQF